MFVVELFLCSIEWNSSTGFLINDGCLFDDSIPIEWCWFLMMIWYSVAHIEWVQRASTYQSWRGLFCGLLTSSCCEKLSSLTSGGPRQLLNTTFIETPFHSPRDLWKKCNGQPQTLFSLPFHVVLVTYLVCFQSYQTDYYISVFTIFYSRI